MPKKQLEKAWDEYQEKIEKIANEQFEKVIKPYLKMHAWSFDTWNGDPVIWHASHHGPKRNITIDIDHLPKKIRDVLNTEVPGVRFCFLSGFMPGYRHEE